MLCTWPRAEGTTEFNWRGCCDIYNVYKPFAFTVYLWLINIAGVVCEMLRWALVWCSPRELDKFL